MVKVIVKAKPSTLTDAILAGIEWVYPARSPLSRITAIDRLNTVLIQLPPDTRAFLRGDVRVSRTEASKHRSRIRRFLWSTKHRVRKKANS